MSKPRSNSKRELILDAAVTVATRQGAAHLTLDAVAKEAKVGKGGLMYHFRDKEALLQAMVLRLREHYQQSLQEVLTELDSSGDPALAHIRLLASADQRLRQLSMIIITVAVHYPGLLGPLQSESAKRSERVLARKGGEETILAMLAINGLFLMECLKVGPLLPKSRQRIIRRLLGFSAKAPASKT